MGNWGMLNDCLWCETVEGSEGYFPGAENTHSLPFYLVLHVCIDQDRVAF